MENYDDMTLEATNERIAKLEEVVRKYRRRHCLGKSVCYLCRAADELLEASNG